jgi:hypothetical protein
MPLLPISIKLTKIANLNSSKTTIDKTHPSIDFREQLLKAFQESSPTKACKKESIISTSIAFNFKKRDHHNLLLNNSIGKIQLQTSNKLTLITIQAHLVDNYSKLL